MKRLSQLTTALYSRVLSATRRCRPQTASNTAREEAISHVRTGSSSSAIITRPSSQTICHPSSPCHCQDSVPSDVHPNHVAFASPCPSRVLDFRLDSPTSQQRPTSPTPIASRAHDLTGEDASPLYQSILSDWDNEDEHVRVRWYIADRQEENTWNSEREHARNPDAVNTVIEMSQYQYIADAWNNETDEVQTRWYLQDKCQKDTWERDCAEAELKGSVPFLEANPAVLRSPSTFSLQASSEHPVHADEVRVLASHGVASSPTIEDLKRTSSPRDILHTVTQ